MEISQKVAYLKGLAEGLALDTESKEGKLIAAIIDVLDDMSEKFSEIDDLSDVEETIYEMDDEDEDEEDYDEDDESEDCFTTTCPCCEEQIFFDESVLESGEIKCPNCGEKLEFDLSDLANAVEDGEDEE